MGDTDSQKDIMGYRDRQKDIMGDRDRPKSLTVIRYNIISYECSPWDQGCIHGGVFGLKPLQLNPFLSSKPENA